MYDFRTESVPGDERTPGGRHRLQKAMRVRLFPDRIKRNQGVWWMPRQQEAMKDVILCDKPWGAENRP